MTAAADAIIGKIRALEIELDSEVARQRAGLGFGLEHGWPRFDAETVRRQKERCIPLGRYLLTATPLVVLTAPFIYLLIIPFGLVDLTASIFQARCFRVYGIPQGPSWRVSHLRPGRVGLSQCAGKAELRLLFLH